MAHRVDLTTEHFQPAGGIRGRAARCRREVMAERVAPRFGLALGSNPCPAHKSRSGTTLKVFQGDRGWFCFNCSRGGGSIELVMLVKRCSQAQAVKYIEQTFGLDPSDHAGAALAILADIPPQPPPDTTLAKAMIARWHETVAMVLLDELRGACAGCLGSCPGWTNVTAMLARLEDARAYLLDYLTLDQPRRPLGVIRMNLAEWTEFLRSSCYNALVTCSAIGEADERAG